MLHIDETFAGCSGKSCQTEAQERGKLGLGEDRLVSAGESISAQESREKKGSGGARGGEESWQQPICFLKWGVGSWVQWVHSVP